MEDFDTETTDSVDDVDNFYGEKSLRWYQIASRNQLIKHLQNKIKRVLIVLPTGAGKTLTVVSSLSHPAIRKALGVNDDRPLRVLFVAHKNRILSQAESTFVTDCNVDLTLQSMFSEIPQHILKDGWDVTILDEAHHDACLSFQLQLEHVGEYPVIGLTATPDRADGYLIKFEEIIEPISRQQAVEEGWLAESELHSIVDGPIQDKTEILTQVIRHFHKSMGQTMIFVRTKREVSNIHSLLTSMNLSSIAITSQSNSQLNLAITQFENKEIQFLINCNKISEGVDVKGCTDIILGRQFGSYPMLNQVIGRSTRPDCESRVWELINPLNGNNLDTTVVIGTPKTHQLHYLFKNEWASREFDYTSI